MTKTAAPLVFSLVVAATLLTSCGFSEGGLASAGQEELASVPYYVIAIHNEPSHRPDGRRALESDYLILKEMVSRADGYGIKLTLMFTAQWADYIVQSQERLADLASWAGQGHEISAHHHSIYHGNWDGYTDYTQQAALDQRRLKSHQPEPYLGTLEDYIAKLKLINPEIKSGCVNDEHDKRAMPDEIIYDTCSGFANHGEPGTLGSDATDPEKGRSEYVTVGTYKGIQRRWLTHYQITTDERQRSAQAVHSAMEAGIYGAVTHSIRGQDEPLYAFMEYLSSIDPSAAGSLTLTEAIESDLLPVELISEELLHQVPPAPQQNKKCGDGLCDQLEKANPQLCPTDCQYRPGSTP